MANARNNKNRIYLTRARYNAYLEEIEYMENEGRQLIAQILAAHPVAGMSRRHTLPAQRLAGEFRGHLQNIKRIANYPVIIDELRDAEPDAQKVTIGCTVAVRYEDDDEVEEYTILDKYEVDPALSRISCWSPIGSALLGKRVGDTVVVKLDQLARELRVRIEDVKRLPLDFDYAPTHWKEKLNRIGSR